MNEKASRRASKHVCYAKESGCRDPTSRRPATRAVVEESILPGGGVALLRSIKAIEKIRTYNDDQETGVDILRKAQSWPARQIALNAGDDGSVVVGKILDKEGTPTATTPRAASMAT